MIKNIQTLIFSQSRHCFTTCLSLEMIAEVGISERGHQLHKGGGGPGQYGDPRVQVMIIMTMLGEGESL